ncbi:RNA 2',3'-cyclic phosphodiesterase [Terribacillus saccharophilus]|uniref:RNA 2',3'-cyclic phosphodiesterase n=1 Tax=Terribacillus saccharophilus TaxID=361277 RepID=UPI003982137D
MSTHYFIGIGADERVQAELTQWQDELKTYVPMKMWPRPEEFHITVQFLGPVAEQQFSRLEEAWNKADFGRAFNLEVSGIDNFGSAKQPRVIWAGVKPLEQLRDLHRNVIACTGKAGFEPEDRPYRPHITLGKKWGSGTVEGKLPLPDKRVSAPFEVGKVTLYRIEPGKRPKYVPVLVKDLEKE